MNAKEARIETHKVWLQQAPEQYKHAKEKIKVAVSMGETSCVLDYMVNPVVLKMLTRERYSCDRNTSFKSVINWEYKK